MNETNPPTSPDSASPGDAAPRPQPQPYELAPEPAPAPTPKPRREPGKIGDAGLLDDFDEDADFDRDPQLERIIKGPQREEPLPAGPVFVKPGMGDAQTVALIACGVLLGAVIASAVTTSGPWYAAGAATAYGVLLHSLTGAGAVAVAAHFTEQQVGSLVLAAARMFLAVSVFALIFHLNIPIAGRFDEVIFAAVGYGAVVWSLFRIWGRPIFFVCAIHAALWMLIWLSGVLAVWAEPAAAVAK